MNEPPIHCRLDCPHHGEHHDNCYLIECACGVEELTCGYCLSAGRLTSCRDCTAKQAEQN